MTSVHSKSRQVVNELGFSGALLYALDRLCSKLGLPVKVIRYLIVAQPVAEKDMLPERRARGIDVRELKPGDPAFSGLPLDQSVLDFRFAQNVICFGAFKDGAVVGCLWLCFGAYQEDEIRCVFEPTPAERCAWDFDVYVDPDHRVGFVFARLWDAANAHMREKGIAASVSRISAFNTQSVTSHARLGAATLGRVSAIALGPVQVTASTFSPRFRLSIGRGPGPTFRIPVDR